MNDSVRKGQDIAVSFPNLFIVHQNIPGKTLSEHQHKGHEVIIPLQGEIKIHVKNQILVCGAGRMIYIPAHTNHEFISSDAGAGERVIIIIDESAWKKERGKTFTTQVLLTNQLFKEIIFYLLLNPKTKGISALKSVLIQVLNDSLDFNHHHSYPRQLEHLKAKIKDQRIYKAVTFLENDYHQPLRLNKIAKQAGLSARTMNRLFLMELGMPPKQFLIQLRVQKAMDLLQSGKHRVTDVAFESGYNSLSQFITTFRHLTGRLPSDYLPKT